MLAHERDACGVGFVADAGGRASRRILDLALDALRGLSHRGGVAADGITGDGAGVLTDLPYPLLACHLLQQGQVPPPPGDLAVAACFLPADAELARAAEDVFARACAEEGLPLLGWREVPVDPSVLGPIARASLPRIAQALIARPAGTARGLAFERKLYLARRRFERAVRTELPAGTTAYVCSMSARTVVYKGLLTGERLGEFYLDLRDPAYAARFCVFHLRYSTNTLPTWERAQPFRMLAHNGEINTLQGNVNGMAAREPVLRVPDWPEAVPEVLRPVIDASGSDSAMLDNVVELFRLAGRDLVHVLELLVPSAWEGIPDLAPELRAFYRFHACLSEPWDGPAALIFADGCVVGAHLDRNGLRPMRYAVLRDGLVVAASEVGAVELPAREVLRFGKLGPGQTVAVDLERKRVLEDGEVKRRLAARRPYGRWLEEHLVTPERLVPVGGSPAAVPAGGGRAEEAQRLATAFGYTREELTVILRPMVESGSEPTGAMGDDTPLAALSRMRRPLYHYFKQRFAQVTNPAIDHLREKLVFSLTTRLGPMPNPLVEEPVQARRIELPSPILDEEQLARLRAFGEVHPEFRTATLSILFDAGRGPEALAEALEELCRRAEGAVDAGAAVLILTDRGVDRARAAIPALLATAAVHHHLIRAGRRWRCSLVVESGEPREVHHLATLLGYGAAAVCPYLALAVAAQLGSELGLEPAQAVRNYRKACEDGLMKVMSKMGISTVDAYIGAQIFEAVGLDRDLVERHFTGTPSQVGGNGLKELAEDVLYWHGLAFGGKAGLVEGYGFYKFKRDGEFHEFNPDVVKAFHVAVRKAAEGGGIALAYPDYYRAYRELVEAGPPSQLRHLLDFRPDRPPVPLDEVEPATAIVRRFSTGAMSLGALSPEAHETLAIAMNRLGARSNSGEGGEDPARYGTERNSAVKQVASGRFGVTPAYLASAVEIQIKMAQGSKPGEGGQIPGHKVTELIARLRHTQPGIPLISPPPHHDIYSIEDLAQLIYDLKQANPEAEISVKLVAETGVGVIAAGVAKGGADIVVISGHAGGTGASPWSSIKNAGLPWELGLWEAQQVLVENGLRHRVALRVDGGMKTGRDVLVAALLGADEYSFGTAALIAEGCVMARICNTNKCPVGVATQDEELRKRFSGTPEQVMAYFLMVAEEVREWLARLGYRSLDEVIGRSDLLVQRKTGDPRADRLDLSALLRPAGRERPAAVVAAGVPAALRRLLPRNDLGAAGGDLGRRVAQEALAAVLAGTRWHRIYRISNRDRAVGATLAWEIARRYGDAGLPEDTIRLRFEGAAGQSFGAFCIRGLRLELVGLANDYVGKGMAGGEIVVIPHPEGPAEPEDHVLVGNTVLYGATGGRLFVAGAAGERFAVRNSGAVAVVEGVGDHACEYMTGGTVVVLGRTGRNFGAGMTGGEAFVFDPEGVLPSRCHAPSVRCVAPDAEALERLRALVAEHQWQTGSRRAAWLLERWAEVEGHFVHVLPVAKPVVSPARGVEQPSRA